MTGVHDEPAPAVTVNPTADGTAVELAADLPRRAVVSDPEAARRTARDLRAAADALDSWAATAAHSQALVAETEPYPNGWSSHADHGLLHVRPGHEPETLRVVVEQVPGSHPQVRTVAFRTPQGHLLGEYLPESTTDGVAVFKVPTDGLYRVCWTGASGTPLGVLLHARGGQATAVTDDGAADLVPLHTDRYPDGLPAFGTGSEAQAAWAMQIRASWAAAAPETTPNPRTLTRCLGGNGKEMTLPGRVCAAAVRTPAFRAALLRELDPAWWIKHRVDLRHPASALRVAPKATARQATRDVIDAGMPPAAARLWDSTGGDWKQWRGHPTETTELDHADLLSLTERKTLNLDPRPRPS